MGFRPIISPITCESGCSKEEEINLWETRSTKPSVHLLFIPYFVISAFWIVTEQKMNCNSANSSSSWRVEWVWRTTYRTLRQIGYFRLVGMNFAAPPTCHHLTGWRSTSLRNLANGRKSTTRNRPKPPRSPRRGIKDSTSSVLSLSFDVCDPIRCVPCGLIA